MKSLYIFVTTNRPDQYLNPIVHCIERGINQIVFVKVDNEQYEQIQLNSLQMNVYNLLQNLSTGNYKYYTGSLKDTVISLETEYNTEELSSLKSKYCHCLSDHVKWNVEKISYLKLKKYISKINKTSDIIIDVTAVSKIYIGDILACCLLENVNKLCTFELLVKPNFDKPWNTLIHELEHNQEYNYTNLVETPIFKESTRLILIRTTPLIFSIMGTILFIALTLAVTLFLGFSSIFAQVMSIIGTVLGIISFFLIYFPIREN